MKKKDRILLIVFVSIFVLVACIGISYAYYTAVIDKGEESSSIISKAGNLEVTYKDGSKQIIGASIFPGWSDSKTFTVENTGDNDSSYSIMVTNIVNNFTVSGSISLSLTSSDGGTSLNKKVLPSSDTYLIRSIDIGVGKTHTYTLTTYYNNLDIDQSEDKGKSFSYTIEIGRAVNKLDEPEGWSTADAGTALGILRETFGSPVEPLTTPGKQVAGYAPKTGAIINITADYAQMNEAWTYGTGYTRNSDGTFNLTGVVKTGYLMVPDMIGTYIPYPTVNQNIANYGKSTDNLRILYYILNMVEEDDKTKITLVAYNSPIDQDEKVMAAAPDDYGTSYYFRGDVDNTYVKFVNKCWRIIRVTGDGSIKMMLVNGGSSDCTTASPYMDDANYDPISTNYNDESLVNSGIGYMYGDYSGSSYEEAHANKSDSTALTGLKVWYDDFLTYVSSSYLSDVIWCNDKSLYSGKGYGAENDTVYGGAGRLNNPSLICPSTGSDGKLSKFTASDTINGNGRLRGIDGTGTTEYKIGLLTLDEALFVGNAYNTFSYNTMTYYITGGYTSKNYFRTMTPQGYDGSGAFMYSFSVGGITTDTIGTTMNYIPVIALKAETPFTGTGTKTDPFHIPMPE